MERHVASTTRRVNAHVVLRAIATLNLALTVVFWKFGHYIVTEESVPLEAMGALLFMWLSLCSFGLPVLVPIGFAHLLRRRDDRGAMRHELKSLFIDAVFVITAYLVWIFQPHSFYPM